MTDGHKVISPKSREMVPRLATRTGLLYHTVLCMRALYLRKVLFVGRVAHETVAVVLLECPGIVHPGAGPCPGKTAGAGCLARQSAWRNRCDWRGKIPRGETHGQKAGQTPDQCDSSDADRVSARQGEGHWGSRRDCAGRRI